MLKFFEFFFHFLRGPPTAGPPSQTPCLGPPSAGHTTAGPLAPPGTPPAGGPPSAAGPPPPDPPKCRSLFPSPAPIFALFSLSLGLFSLNFGGVFEGRDPQMCTFALSGCRVKPRRPLAKMGAGEGKKRENLLPPAFGPPPYRAPTLRGPTILAPTLQAPTLGASIFSFFGPLRSSFLSCCSFVLFFGAFFNCFYFLSFFFFLKFSLFLFLLVFFFFIFF